MGNRRSRDKGTRRGIGQQGRLVGVHGVVGAAEVRVGGRGVVWAAVVVGQRESVPMVHGGGDVGLRPPVGVVSVPLLVAGAVMLHLLEETIDITHTVLVKKKRRNESTGVHLSSIYKNTTGQCSVSCCRERESGMTKQ